MLPPSPIHTHIHTRVVAAMWVAKLQTIHTHSYTNNTASWAARSISWLRSIHADTAGVWLPGQVLLLGDRAIHCTTESPE